MGLAGAAVVLFVLVALTLGAGGAQAAGVVYAAGSNSGQVFQYDVGSGGALTPKTPASVPAGRSAEAVSLAPDGSNLYAAGCSDPAVWQFDVDARGGLAAKSSASVAAGRCATGIVASPNGTSVYVIDEGDNVVFQYDVRPGGALAAKFPPTVPTGGSPRGITITPNGSSAYVTNEGDNTISQYDIGAGGLLAAKSPATIAAVQAFEIAISPDGKNAYATTPTGNQSATAALSGSIYAYDIAADGTLSPKPGPPVAAVYPIGIAVSPDGKSVYATKYLHNGISQYDVGPGGTLKPKSQPSVTAGALAYAIAISPDGHDAYATNQGDGTISQYSVQADGALTPKTPATVKAGAGVRGIAIRLGVQPPPPLPPPPPPLPLARMLALSITPHAFRAAPTGPSTSRVPRVSTGARISYALTINARVRFTFAHALAGRRVGNQCHKPSTSTQARPRCTRYLAARGAFTSHGRAGANRLRFTGRLAGHKLAPGRYRITGTPIGHPHTAASRAASFTILT